VSGLDGLGLDDAAGGRLAAQRAQSAVALGGGHGLFASLNALRRLVDDLVLDQLTAIVTVADNGGSSGRLRREFGCLPPGDLRMALAALCGEDEWEVTWARVLQHRFAGDGEMNGHNLGNLLIVALWELLGDHVAALDRVCLLLGAKGRVLPMALVPMDITARIRGLAEDDPDRLTVVRGQVEVATAGGIIVTALLDGTSPPATPDAVRAVLEADWVFLGPGSWFTSVIPHLLVPELLDALTETKARLVLSLNLAPQPGETDGFSPQRHLEVLGRHAPKLALDVVLADQAAVPDRESLADAAQRFGAAVELARVAREDGSPKHDPELLAAAYDRIFRMHGRIGPWR